MDYAQIHQQPPRRYFIKCAAVIALMVLIAAACAAQAAPKGQPEMPWTKDLNKYPGLLEEFGRLMERLEHNLQFPTARSQGRLLPLLPESTMSYAAFPNYGEVTHQALKVFRQELQESAVLRDWWQHGELATTGPKVEDSVEKFYQLSQYLGEEIVVSGAMQGRDTSLLIAAEVRKPGLKKFLEQMVRELSGSAKPPVRVLDLQELATAEDRRPSQELVVLVRPDFVVAAPDVATLRSFNARLERSSREFASTPFGRRIAQSYEGGATIVAAADLQKILNQVPQGAKDQATFQRTGLGDVKYLVWERKSVAGRSSSQMELSFTGLRHGVASWLAAPAPLGGLDFVSPKAMLAAAVLLKDPAQILDDVIELTSDSKPNPLATLAQSEAALKLSFKDDLLRQLGGEITLELDNVNPPDAEWKAILRVNDAGRLQQTLSTLLAAVHFEAQQSDRGGVSYRTVRIPSGKKTTEIGYAFVDGYLVVGSSYETVAEAVRLHRTGESLGKSRKFLAALPPGHPSGASALLYQDPFAMTALRLRLVAPELAESLSRLSPTESAPAVVGVYGEESAIREISTSGAVDVGAVLVIAAIAIPNLLRSRIAANEASAVGTIRTVNVAQVMHAATYPERGYAPTLATLGPGPGSTGGESADHAGFIDATLGNASCTAGAWCTKSGFQFAIKPVCIQQQCSQYVVVGTPVASNTGGRSFCSTSDGVIRFKTGPPLTTPVNASECKAWTPLQ